MGPSPAFGSSFESFSCRAIALFPTHPHLYVASYLDSRSMPYRHGSFPALGYVMQTSYDPLSLARLAAEPIAALDPGVGPTQSSIRISDCASLCGLCMPSPE